MSFTAPGEKFRNKNGKKEKYETAGDKNVRHFLRNTETKTPYALKRDKRGCQRFRTWNAVFLKLFDKLASGSQVLFPRVLGRYREDEG